MAQEFLLRLEQEQPKYLYAHCIRLNRMTKFYSVEQLLDGMEFCFKSGHCSAYELAAYLMYRHGPEKAKLFMNNQQYFNHLTRSKEIRREIDG